MTYSANLIKYYKKHFQHSQYYCNYKALNNKYKYFMIIPIYNEYNYILKTLESINSNQLKHLKNLLVVLVINNRINENDNIIESNHQTHQLIIKHQFSYEYIVIDCYSKKNALNEKYAGVGMARKIGMDFCLQYSGENSLLCCMDADTIISKEYFSFISSIFNNNKVNACTINFKHQKTSNKKLKIAIVKYEKELKNIALHIQESGSPYGYVSMGSTILCKAKTYIAVGGMPKRNATEDFYFLQSLAKHTKIYFIKNILVFPSPRCEQRVYLGTGYRMQEYKQKNYFVNFGYSNSSYKALKKLLYLVNKHWGKDYIVFKKYLNQFLDNTSIQFLEKNDFMKAWQHICTSTKTKKQFILFFNQWFDALKTIKFLKALSTI